MTAPQILYIVWFTTIITVHLIKHGETSTGKYNFFAALVLCGVQLAILMWGGFF